MAVINSHKCYILTFQVMTTRNKNNFTQEKMLKSERLHTDVAIKENNASTRL